ncbi:MAG: extracellular solute-binding protein, partial [Oscillospiraceae bacterium]|nr:extracellular solute-binding protein [Oscillospiraceae bacterium]
SWEQYADLAAELTYEEGGTQFTGGVIPPWVFNLGASPAGEYLNSDPPMPFTRRYIEILHRMMNIDKSHPGIAELRGGVFDIYAFFETGNVYMMVNGSWTVTMFGDQGGDFELAIAPLPVFQGVPAGSTAGSFSVWSVTEHSKVPREAYQFLEFATMSEGGSIVLASDGTIPLPNYPSAAQAFQDRMGTTFGMEHWLNATIHPEQNVAVPYYGRVRSLFNEEIDVYLLGEVTLDQFFENYFAMREHVIAEG